MKSKQITIVLLVLCSFVSSYAQQESHYTQYMYNMSVVNPAYVLDEPGAIQIGSLYRTQWVGIKGAPQTANLFGRFSAGKNVELCVNYVNDRIGSTSALNQNLFNVDFAYKLKLNESTGVALGLKAGLFQIGVDFSKSNLQADPAFQNTSESALLIGAGTFLFGKKYYLGISTPNLLSNEMSVNNQSIYTSNAHLAVIGGYVFDVGRKFKVKPAAVLRFVSGAPLSYAGSLNFLFYDKMELGASYRSEDAITALVGFYLSPKLRIGYSYDYNISDLSPFHSGSHEIVLLFDINLIGMSKKYLSPRFY